MPGSFVPTVTAITTSQDLQWLVQPTLISSMAQSQGQPPASQPPAVDPYDMPGTSYSTPGLSAFSTAGASTSGGPSTSTAAAGPVSARPARARPRRPREETVSMRPQELVWRSPGRRAQVAQCLLACLKSIPSAAYTGSGSAGLCPSSQEGQGVEASMDCKRSLF